MIKNAIVLVPFPFDDFSATKVRPALCLTSEIGEHDHVVIAFISSKMPEKPIGTDVLVRLKSPSAQGTGLIVDSVIRLHRIVTIPKYLIKRRLGQISHSVASEVVEKIRLLFGKE